MGNPNFIYQTRRKNPLVYKRIKYWLHMIGRQYMNYFNYFLSIKCLEYMFCREVLKTSFYSLVRTTGESKLKKITFVSRTSTYRDSISYNDVIG